MVVCPRCGAENPEGFRFCGQCTSPLAEGEPLRQARKVVTALFCDVTGSTALGERLDPEVLREVLNRYFEVMREIIERHGGTVEKFVGDAVMAVFGIPRVHEDDALRAVRAAAEIRERLPAVAEEVGVALRFRTGVNTGAVLMSEGENLAIGDAVNVAARLEQAAAPGEIVIGRETLALVRPVVEVGEERLLDLKGKSERVAAYPLLAVVGVLERRFSTPLVGRENEIEHLRVVFNQAVRDRSCRLFTVLGSAGVGKSRLVAEFLVGLEARVVRGRCLSYGEGITYWPVVEVLRQLGTLPEGDAARPVRSLLGETGEVASAEEIAWGFRKLLEQEAQSRPLALVLDDLHWAEETLFDLIEHVAELSRDAPLLLLCMARPELLERRPSWGGGKWNATTLLLEPLDAAETERLLAELGGVSDELRERIVRVAEGNPLFVEEMLALVRHSPDAEVEVPPSIRALLAARLDQLDPAERAVLERGSVEGRSFHRGAVVALADGEGRVDQRLLALVRKELLRPDRPVFAGDDAYRFRHLLIRDAAYDALPKTVRADLHRRFAAWLEQHGRELVELDEILGYHLEQAARYLDELGRPDPQLALAAGDRLAAAGRHALARGDDHAAARLLERALTLTRPHRLEVHLELDLACANSTHPREAAALAAAAAERAAAAGDATGEAYALSVAAFYELSVEKLGPDRLEARARAALPMLERAGDDAGLAEVWHMLGFGVANMRGHWAEQADAEERAFLHARRAGRPWQPVGFVLPLVIGPVPAGAALERLDELAPDPTPLTLSRRCVLVAMLDRVEEARQVALQAHERLVEQTGQWFACWPLAEIALLAGDLDGAARHLRTYCEWLDETENYAYLSTLLPLLGRVLCALGRYDEAEPLAQRGRELGDEQDAVTQALWRQVQALVHASRGQQADAERLAREAVAITENTDSLWRQGDALCDLADVLQAAGRHDEAAAALREALDRYERKEIIPLVRRTSERIATLEETPA
jgi:class 3 adenylate cyclase/tetratricopeptide (TPR) repeat protein